MNIGAPKAIWRGTGRAVRNWRLLVLFYVLNFIFAAVIALPFAAIFAKDISRSVVGSELLKGFSYRWYVEFFHANETFFNSLLPQLLVLFILYVIMKVFLAGGFYTVFAAPARSRASAFFSACASKFFPLLAVTLAEVFLLLLLFEGNAAWAAANNEAAKTALTDNRILHAAIWRYAVVAVVFMIINMSADFTKAAVSIDDDKFLSKVRRGLAFTFRHPLSTAGTYLGGTIIGAAVVLLYFRVDSVMDSANVEVIVGIAVAQIFILFRIFSKLIFYAGEAALYKENQIEVINVKREMLE
jgi:hypothetical protein